MHALLIFQKLLTLFGVQDYFKKLVNQLGIGGNYYKVVKYMYSNSKFTVKKDNCMSDIGVSEKGVRRRRQP